MCRMAAYLGPEIRLAQFLLQPPHSLVTQAHSPRELTYTKVNADGFGFAWLSEDGRARLYLNTLPIWSDPNLVDLGEVLASGCWLANVRSATPGLGISPDNTQPFRSSSVLFMHNGFVRQFQSRVRPALHQFLDPSIQSGIRGDTDSEYLFALLRHVLDADPALSMEGAVAEVFDLLGGWAEDVAAMLNLIIRYGERLYAVRHAMNQPCPSLYFTSDDEGFPGGQLVASEPLTDADYWTAVPEHHLLILDPGQPPELLPL